MEPREHPHDQGLVSIPYGSFGPQLESLVSTLINKIDREPPSRLTEHPGARNLFLNLLRVSENTYETIKFITADAPANLARRLEFSLSVSPLSRTILDTLFAIVFLSGSLRNRVQWYYAAGWREVYDENERLIGRYSSDPAWTAHLAELHTFLNRTRQDWGIAQSQYENPKSIRRWPNPGRMSSASSDTGNRGEYLNPAKPLCASLTNFPADFLWRGISESGQPLHNELGCVAPIPSSDTRIREKSIPMVVVE